MLRYKKTLNLFVLLLVIAVFLIGCSGQDERPQLLPVDVEIMLDPEEPQPKQEIEIQALVTQGEEFVDDADEVKFEIWEKGEPVEVHTKVEGEHQGEGLYTTSHTFEADGIYYVIAHVTARDLHTMPKKEIIVGSPDPGKYEGVMEEEHMEMDEMTDHSEGH